MLSPGINKINNVSFAVAFMCLTTAYFIFIFYKGMPFVFKRLIGPGYATYYF